MKEQEFEKIFAAHKVDVPDEGFSERITRQLPERKSLLPQIIMATFIVTGFALVFAIQGFVPVIDQIYSLITSISQMQLPSPSSIITYLSILVLTWIISYCAIQVAEY